MQNSIFFAQRNSSEENSLGFWFNENPAGHNLIFHLNLLCRYLLYRSLFSFCSNEIFFFFFFRFQEKNPFFVQVSTQKSSSLSQTLSSFEWIFHVRFSAFNISNRENLLVFTNGFLHFHFSLYFHFNFLFFASFAKRRNEIIMSNSIVAADEIWLNCEIYIFFTFCCCSWQQHATRGKRLKTKIDFRGVEDWRWFSIFWNRKGNKKN